MNDELMMKGRGKTVAIFMLFSLLFSVKAEADAPTSRRTTRPLPKGKPLPKKSPPSTLPTSIPRSEGGSGPSEKGRVRGKIGANKKYRLGTAPKRSENSKAPPQLELLGGKDLSEFIKPLAERNWWKQADVISTLSADPEGGKRAFRWIFENHRSLRARLLAAQALALLGDYSALPTLMRWAREWFDQPNPLLTGALIAVGERALPQIHTALKRWEMGKLAFIVRVAGIIGNIDTGRALLSLLLRNPPTDLRDNIWDSFKNFSKEIKFKLVRELLSRREILRKLTSNDASELVRAVGNVSSPHSIPLLLELWETFGDKVSFLSRLFLEDLYRRFAPKCGWKVPSRPGQNTLTAWKTRWKEAKSSLHRCPKPRELTEIPEKNLLNSVLYYRTMHPIFSYGWMPLYAVHVGNTQIKEPRDKNRRKYWVARLRSEELLSLLEMMRELKFTSWPRNMGVVRKLTLRHGRRSRTVSIGMIRFLPFEQIERRLVLYGIRADLTLGFEDFFLRLDEEDLTAEGKVGQWAFRSGDRLDPAVCNKLSPHRFTSALDLYQAFRELMVRLPSRTRLSFFDLLGSKLRLGALLYSTSIQSRWTRDALVRSPLFGDFKLLGIGMIQLATDKLEEMIFELKLHTSALSASPPEGPGPDVMRGKFRLPSPNASSTSKPSSSPKSAKGLPSLLKGESENFLKFFRKALKGRGELFGKPKVLSGGCTFVRFKVRDSWGLGELLYLWALKRGEDRISAMRINHSGERDRDRYRLIVQLSVRVQTPVGGEKRRPSGLKLPPPPGPALSNPIFQPIYR